MMHSLPRPAFPQHDSSGGLLVWGKEETGGSEKVQTRTQETYCNHCSKSLTLTIHQTSPNPSLEQGRFGEWPWQFQFSGVTSSPAPSAGWAQTGPRWVQYLVVIILQKLFSWNVFLKTKGKWINSTNDMGKVITRVLKWSDDESYQRTTKSSSDLFHS